MTIETLAGSFSGVAAGGSRPMLSADVQGGGFGAFVRSGMTVETKAVTGTTDAAGGHAVPREIDAMIGATLKAASPIRAIAQVVSVGSAGYRKLVTSGATPSGWASDSVASRPRP